MYRVKERNRIWYNFFDRYITDCEDICCERQDNKAKHTFV
jgi:hypothetical protein